MLYTVWNKTWRITYEIPPMRGIYCKDVDAVTPQGAVEFLESLNNYQIKVVKVEEVVA